MATMTAPSQIFLSPIAGSTTVLRDVRTLSELHAAASRAHDYLPADDLVLTHGGRVLSLTRENADAALADLGVGELSTVFASARLVGGGKKRKKKTYTKPKKIKHKHKTVKLGVLKNYKVSADGEVTRLRKECPEQVCGPGVFMAAHSDRVYCGKCGLTYVENAA